MTNQELETQIVDLRLRQMQLRDSLVEFIREVDTRKLWKEAGKKSLREYCEQVLGYDPIEAREVMVAAGAILTTDKMISDVPAVQKRIENLRNWRKQKSLADNIAAYLILSNRTLMAVAERNPRTMDALLAVPGVGPKKAAAFGTELLAQLQD